MSWAFEGAIFQIFANFWVAKLKLFSGKVRQSVQKYLNRSSVLESILEYGFEVTTSSEANVLSVWKGYFSVFCKLLCDEVETVSWESEVKRSKLFKSKFGHRKLLIKWFWSHLELKNECSVRLKRVFFSFFANFWVTKLKPFSGKARQCCKNFFHKVYFV